MLLSHHGSGESTLLKIGSGIEQSTTGDIIIISFNVTKMCLSTTEQFSDAIISVLSHNSSILYLLLWSCGARKLYCFKRDPSAVTKIDK